MKPSSFREADLATFTNMIRGKITEWASHDGPQKWTWPITNADTSKEYTLYLVKSIVLQAVPDSLQEKIHDKLKLVTLLTLPRVLSRAMSESSNRDTEPSTLTVNFANTSLQGGRGQRGTGRGQARGQSRGSGTGRGYGPYSHQQTSSHHTPRNMRAAKDMQNYRRGYPVSQRQTILLKYPLLEK